MLLVSFALNLTPVWWGLPDLWPYDEIRPREILDGRARPLQGGFNGYYPPLHYYLLTLVHIPAEAMHRAGWWGADTNLTTVLAVAFRVVSSTMATAAVGLFYLCGRVVSDRRTAVVASLLIATILPYVYYAKTSNVDMPYVFWFSLALLFFLRLLRDHEPRDYVGLGVAAAAAVATKDQAFALFVLAPALVLVRLHRHRLATGTEGGLFRTVADRRIIMATAAAALTYAALHNLLFDWSGFLRHVELLATRPLVEGNRHANTPAGHLTMAIETAKHLSFSVGLPVFSAAVVGSGVSLYRRESRRAFLPIATVAASYYLFFVSVVRINFVRFLLPISILLTFFAAYALTCLVGRSRRLTWVTTAVIVATCGYNVVRATSLDYSMVNDSRYAVEDWLERNAAEGDTVVAVGSKNLLPRGLHVVDPGAVLYQQDRLRRLDARYVVVNALETAYTPGSVLHARLTGGEHNFRLRARLRPLPPFDLSSPEGIETNLGSINPPMLIFEAQRGWARTQEELLGDARRLALSHDPQLRSSLGLEILDRFWPQRHELLGDEVVAVGLAPAGGVREGYAAVAARNSTARPTRVELRMQCPETSGSQPFNVTVTGDDGRETFHPCSGRSHSDLSLGPLEPGAVRVYLVTVDDIPTPPQSGVRRPPVRLAVAAERSLRGDRIVSYGLAPRGRMLGSTAQLLVRNETEQSLVQQVKLICDAAAADLPLTVWVHGTEATTRHVFNEAEAVTLSLPPVAAHSSAVFHVAADQGGRERSDQPVGAAGVRIVVPDEG